MSTGNWWYDTQLARQQARELADEMERRERRRSRVAHPMSKSNIAKPFCSQCGREWRGKYFSTRALIWAVVIGYAVGFIACALMIRTSTWLW